jgi:hypothetical protein
MLINEILYLLLNGKILESMNETKENTTGWCLGTANIVRSIHENIHYNIMK